MLWVLKFRCNGNPLKFTLCSSRADAMKEARRLLTQKWRQKKGVVWSVQYSIIAAPPGADRNPIWRGGK